MEFDLIKINDEIESNVSSNAPVNTPFTPRLQILYGLSQVVKEWKDDQGEKPLEGDFWLGPPGGQNLKRQIYVVPITLRDHALRYSGKTVNLESFKRPTAIMPPQNKDEEIFREIEKSPKQDQAKKQMNNWGMDVLLWLPIQRTFAIHFLHSTARSAASQFKDPVNKVNNLGKLMLWTSRRKNSASFSWWGPEATFPPPFDLTDSTQATLVESIKNNIPDHKEELVKFLNPIPQGVGRESAVQNPGGGIR